ncbi:hypothetical protein [Niabella hibiscisoli]|uniref:hypothetical protein n=1 Tax=Niabella hibiscisoli TaxID=1825928 RepID=UPI001F0FD0FB|nr:hypothetical protein [Niabella hibiscisoli]MCH5719814.1 hypothetical protein [Niabella hibiscisoli]
MQSPELNQQKNRQLSLALIVLNVILVLCLELTGKLSEDESALNLLLAGISATVLLGVFAFGYKGRGGRLGKWLFVIVLLLTLGYGALIWYAFQLGKAFQH